MSSRCTLYACRSLSVPMPGRMMQLIDCVEFSATGYCVPEIINLIAITIQNWLYSQHLHGFFMTISLSLPYLLIVVHEKIPQLRTEDGCKKCH